MKSFPNLVAIKYFNARDLQANHIKDDHSFVGIEVNISVVGAVWSLRARFSVESGTKIIATAAAVMIRARICAAKAGAFAERSSPSSSWASVGRICESKKGTLRAYAIANERSNSNSLCSSVASVVKIKP
ncbi:MAG TPA: hypothetical protein VGJ30_19695 [Candidatus Angelobacter sp.]|jgi:hypothetical protein